MCNGRTWTGLKCYKISVTRLKKLLLVQYLHDAKKETNNFICPMHRHDIRESHAKKITLVLIYSSKVTHETSPLKLLLLYVVGLKHHQKINS